jgi:hypothetical protein
MTENGITCYILPLGGQGFAREADPAQVAFTWDALTLAERLSHGIQVAPGVRVALLSTGDHWQPGEGKTIAGSLIAVHRR